MGENFLALEGGVVVENWVFYISLGSNFGHRSSSEIIPGELLLLFLVVVETGILPWGLPSSKTPRH